MNVVLLAVAFYGGFFLLFTLPVIIFIVKMLGKTAGSMISPKVWK